MEALSTNPRRRRLVNSSISANFPPAHVPTDVSPLKTSGLDLSLKKGSTFHNPSSPRSPDHDPVLSVPSLPRRSPTCYIQLEDPFNPSENRIAQLIGAVDRSLSGLGSFTLGSQETIVPEVLPVPRFMVDNSAQDDVSMDLDVSSPQAPRVQRRHHASDSGIGSTETSEHSALGDDARVKQEVCYSGHSAGFRSPLDNGSVKTGINGNGTVAAVPGTTSPHTLSEYACRQIQKHIILPIIREEKLKPFHPLVGGLPYRVARKEITCLRDLEKVLLWLAPKWSDSKTSFLLFCETSIQCIHTTVEYLNETDQRRPTDRPYNQGYFLDLVEQVRQYAAMLASSRTRPASGAPETHEGGEERLNLVGGLGQTGVPAELVRTTNGKSVSLRTGEEVSLEDYKQGTKRLPSQISDEDTLRSMARRKKSAGAAIREEHRCRECSKTFKRPCDLTKHEKTHSRPWKCSESNCKYHEYGWPTEKERDRHVNDKHSASPAMYKCQFHPCPYESKRESNCKQHMEKAHGWTYVRSKNNGKNVKRPSNAGAPPTPQDSTPGSIIFSAPTPDLSDATPFPENETPSHEPFPNSGLQPPFADNFQQDGPSPFSEMFGPVDPGFTWNDGRTEGKAFHGDGVASHRASWDSEIAGPSTLQSSFEDQSLFGNNFDWSNMNHDLTALNFQLATPATSVEQIPAQIYSRNASISLDQSPLSASHPSLSPGGHGDAMLYTPFSAPSNEMSIDEGYDEFTQDLVPKPSRDFNLFDNNTLTTVGMNGEGAMFEDLSSLHGSAGWTAKSADLTSQLGMEPDLLMRMEE